jgi:hypothetical protein
VFGMPSDLRGITLKIVGIGCIALPSKRWRRGLLLPLGENMSLGSRRDNQFERLT